MTEYTVIYQWAGRNYSVSVPDLPGCVACGDTMDEAQQFIKEAIELHIDALKEEGQPVPEPMAKAGLIAVDV
jgi:predicted RNase H-like HicB family nuclease